MNESGRLMIRKILIIMGLILIGIAIAIGISIIIFSFKYINGIWLSFGKYLISMIVLALSGAIVGVLGIFIIYLSIDTNDLEKNK